MQKFKVRFLPDEKEIEVESGVTLLEAAERADIRLDSICGGEGLCGECRLQVLSGNARADKHAIGFFSREEIQKGYVLACQTRVEDNLEVMVPAKSRVEAEHIVTEGAPVSYSEPERVVLYKRPYDPASFFEPLVSKVYLELPEPSIEDNASDIDRIIRQLRKTSRYPSFEISLSCLQGLAGKLRRSQWRITATLARHDGIGRVLEIEEGDTSEHNYGLAVDVGTTTVVAQLVHIKTGKVMGIEASHNLQARYGEDVITRMVFACGRGSLHPLHESIVGNINSLIKALCQRTGINSKDITCMVAAGNTTMSHFLLNLVPCSIRLEPYVPTATIYPQVSAKDIGINISPEGMLEVMPSVASYMGGDIVAGILACGLADKPEGVPRLFPGGIL